jgi:hypothetical protein
MITAAVGTDLESRTPASDPPSGATIIAARRGETGHAGERLHLSYQNYRQKDPTTRPLASDSTTVRAVRAPGHLI